jgi:hypothetical protein
LQGPCTIAVATAFAIGASAAGRAQDASRLQWRAPHLCFQHRHGRICLCRSFGATANQAKKVVGCCHLVFAGNDRDTSNSIETSDAAAKKLGDQFFEKLAAVVGSTPKLRCCPAHRRTNEAWCGPRSWSRCCCISAVTHSAIRQASRRLAIEVHRRANARLRPSYVGIVQSAERAIGYDDDYKYRSGVAYQPSPSRRANGVTRRYR